MASFHYRILVVDDDEGIRLVSEQVLSQCGYEVRTANDGFEALALMRKALPDLIISDLNMPNMSGFELLSIVRRRFPQLPVIAITGEYSTSSQPEELLADALFHKGQYSRASIRLVNYSKKFNHCWSNHPSGHIFPSRTEPLFGYREMAAMLASTSHNHFRRGTMGCTS